MFEPSSSIQVFSFLFFSGGLGFLLEALPLPSKLWGSKIPFFSRLLGDFDAKLWGCRDLGVGVSASLQHQRGRKLLA